MTDERVQVSLEDALKRIGDGGEIHTFRQWAFGLIGADWPREKLIEAIEKYGVEESGQLATSMHHGLVLMDGQGPLFIETVEEES